MSTLMTVIVDEDGRYLGTIDDNGKMVDAQVLSTRLDDDDSDGDERGDMMQMKGVSGPMGYDEQMTMMMPPDDYDEYDEDEEEEEEDELDAVAMTPKQRRQREAERLEQILTMDKRSLYSKEDFSFIKSSSRKRASSEASDGIDNLFDPSSVQADAGYFSEGDAGYSDGAGGSGAGYFSDGDYNEHDALDSQLKLKKLNPFRKMMKNNKKSKGGGNGGLMGTAVLWHRGRVYVARESGEVQWNLPSFQFEPWSQAEVAYAKKGQRNLNELVLERFNKAIVMTGLSRTAPDYKYTSTGVVMMGDNHAVLVAVIEDALDSGQATPFNPAQSAYDELVAVSWEEIRRTMPRIALKRSKLKFRPQVATVLRGLKKAGYLTKNGITIPAGEAIVPDGRQLSAASANMAPKYNGDDDDDDDKWTPSADHLPYFAFYSMADQSHQHLVPQMAAFSTLFSEADSGRMFAERRGGFGRGRGRRGFGRGRGRGFGRRRRWRRRGLFGGPWRYGRGRFWRRGLVPWVPFVPLRYLAWRNVMFPRTYARINEQMPRATSLPSLPSFTGVASGQQVESQLRDLRTRYSGLRNMGYDVVPNFTNRRFEWARVVDSDANRL